MADHNHGIAARLRAARLEQGLEIDALSRELKNPRAVLEAIERGDWGRLGAPVFVRHLVGRYATRLGVTLDLDDVVERVESPVLRPRVSTSRVGRLADFSTRNAAYVGGTLLLLPLVYLALSWTGSEPAEYRALDPVQTSGTVAAVAEPSPATPETVLADADAPLPSGPADPALASEATSGAGLAASALADPASPAVEAEAAPAAPAPAPAPTPVAASLAGGLMPNAPQLVLQFSGESWIEIFGRDGAVIERALARSGEARRFAAADVGRVTIGNVDATSVVLDGSSVNLDGVRAANVARFALSSDGSIEAVTR